MAIKMEGDTARAWIAKMSEYEKVVQPATVSAVQIPEHFIVIQDGDVPITGTLYCRARCWLVRSSQGTLYAVPDMVFRAQYRRVEDVSR
jgi:hypothetical protein